MFANIIDTIAGRLSALQETAALTDRATAAAVQLVVRTGALPKELQDRGEEVAAPLLEAAWLLFLAAPARAPRYLLVSSMHLNLVITEEEARPLDSIFNELRRLEEVDPESLEGNDWLTCYRRLGLLPLPEEADRVATVRERLLEAREILSAHHEEVFHFSRDVINNLAEDLEQAVKDGSLGAVPEFITPSEDDPDALVEHAILRAAMEDLSGALDDFNRALAIDDRHLVALLNRALVYHSLGRTEEAIKDYDTALEQVDDDPEIWTNRGIARFAADDFAGARHDFDRAIGLNDKLAPAFLHRGNLHRVFGEPAKAFADYERAIKIQPDFVDVYAARGFLYLQLEEAEKASADFGMAIGLRPGDAELYYNRAYARLLNQDISGAIADYDLALEIEPDDVEALANRGAAKMASGDLDGALQDWEAAIEIDPYYPTAYLKRASLWLATEQPEEAARDLKTALEHAPQDWPYRKKVEETLEDLLDELGFDSAN